MSQFFRYVLGAVAALGFVLSLAVHIQALMGRDVASSVPAVWMLHLGIFVVFLPFVLLSRKDFKGARSALDLAKGLPLWVAALGGVIFVYALMNFVVFMVHTDGGNPVFEDGKYLLMQHGKLIREITASEFAAFQANELRGFSGHWLVFYFVPAAYFLFWKRDAQALSSSTLVDKAG
ncbi:hypothetical protein [Dyella sp. C11]|uniref:hypothetical protein n=1 Tax=Dyella sp. C11 TaxID=2126991 RepID=UPI000D653BF9|nr:hypothetical protein [Dyella sp. C11]